MVPGQRRQHAGWPGSFACRCLDIRNRRSITPDQSGSRLVEFFGDRWESAGLLPTVSGTRVRVAGRKAREVGVGIQQRELLVRADDHPERNGTSGPLLSRPRVLQADCASAVADDHNGPLGRRANGCAAMTFGSV